MSTKKIVHPLFARYVSRQQSVAAQKIIAKNLGLVVYDRQEVLTKGSKYKPHQGRKESLKAAKRKAAEEARAKGKTNVLPNPPDIQQSGSSREQGAENKDEQQASSRESPHPSS